MTLEELKELLSTYGVNDQERNAPVLVDGMPLAEAEVDWTWTPSGGRHTVRLSSVQFAENGQTLDQKYGAPCIVCNAPIIDGIGHDDGCMVMAVAS